MVWREPATTSATGNWKASDKGFTLLEVLIASAILLIGVSLISAQINRHLSILRLLQDSMKAYRLADGQLIGAIQRHQAGQPVQGQGSDQEFFWSVRLEELQPPLPGLDAVVSEVSWNFRDSRRSTRVITGLSQTEKEARP